MYEYIREPEKIEAKSFEMIGEALGEKNVPGLRTDILKRVIHTTADFEYGDLLAFKPEVETHLLEAIKKGCTIVSDTNMIKAGISKKLAEKFGVRIFCYVDDPSVHEIAKAKGITRSMAAIDKASELEGEIVFVIGNAPTALYRILELSGDGKLKPAAVVGVPVGFVGAAESKDALWEKDLPAIITKGRKGGSTIGVAIINAVLREAAKHLG